MWMIAGPRAAWPLWRKERRRGWCGCWGVRRRGGASDAGVACHGNAGRGRWGAGVGAEAENSTAVKSRGPAKEGLCKKGTGSESQQTRDMAT